MNLSLSLQQRRKQLAESFRHPAILWSGKALSRNFPANHYSFRANSHFLYFAGLQLENTAIYLHDGRLELFMDNPPPDDALWHGEMATRAEIAETIGADAAYPLKELANKTVDVANIATIPVQDRMTHQQQCQFLQRDLPDASALQEIDLALAKAIVNIRLCHDEYALQELKKAARVTVKAHKEGIKATRWATTESEIRSAMEAIIIAHNMTHAYNSIVTTRGEVLHNEHYHNQLQPGDLILADVGAETASGWAADVTRTWAVSGKFSSTQRDIYDIVLEAHDVCIAKMHPGIEYREIHLLAATVIAEGLVNLGILKGNPASLVERDVHALFFPHGIGHLLGLDVHDMEDLGDIAGYETGRNRSDRFGLKYLRLDRKLRSGMLVTIEPGFYQVPGILNNSRLRQKYRGTVDWERLTLFSDVRGIRIEDDVSISDDGIEVLTSELPNKVSALEALAVV